MGTVGTVENQICHSIKGKNWRKKNIYSVPLNKQMMLEPPPSPEGIQNLIYYTWKNCEKHMITSAFSWFMYLPRK